MTRNTLSRWLSAAALALASLAGTAAHAGPYTNMFVFGDSLTDTGNIFLATAGSASPQALPPYYQGRFSDGPLWIDVLAQGLGLPAGAAPSLLGGTNFAWAGARTGRGTTPPGLLLQEEAFTNSVPTLDPNALYVVVGGGNDMRDARNAFTSESGADQAGRQAAANAAVLNLSVVVTDLASRGAKHFLVGNLPNLGLTAEAALLGLQAASTDASNRFNERITGLVNFGSNLGLDMNFLDMAGIVNAVYADALLNNGATYGITNLGLPCFLANVPSCAAYASVDGLHPTAPVHALFGQAALQAVAVPVPEPETLLLMSLGLAALAWRQRARSA
ncbi:PEP-CTERM putative exosortase interaction domain-containing protein [Burkholderiales bacterium JOSHI_001]|nr:PEP-CTERM putative exosortase interaction domain-containing protein [Burkholderiales bacterium JOSHI_001]